MYVDLLRLSAGSPRHNYSIQMKVALVMIHIPLVRPIFSITNHNFLFIISIRLDNKVISCDANASLNLIYSIRMKTSHWLIKTNELVCVQQFFTIYQTLKTETYIQLIKYWTTNEYFWFWYRHIWKMQRNTDDQRQFNRTLDMKVYSFIGRGSMTVTLQFTCAQDVLSSFPFLRRYWKLFMRWLVVSVTERKFELNRSQLIKFSSNQFDRWSRIGVALHGIAIAIGRVRKLYAILLRNYSCKSLYTI